MNSLSNELKVSSIYHDCDSRQWIITLNNRQMVFSDSLSNIDNIIRYFINMQNGIIPFAKRVNFEVFSFTSKKDFKNSISNDNGMVVFNSDSLVITYTNFNNEYDDLSDDVWNDLHNVVLFNIYTNNTNDKVVNKAAKQLYSLFSSIYKYHYDKDYMKWYLYNYIYTNNYIDYMDNKYIERGCF